MSEIREQEEKVQKLLLTVEETAQVLGIGRTKVFDLIANRAIASVRIGGSRRIPTSAVEEFIERLRSETTP